ncbi:hypothetical protein D5041_07815 [Verminephrobacter aporrectodeae subsp. tuberculatae]|uniref:putative holin n=1 Tax=Verminephrobacter aporrectodeae TaxID=1110389 RepID=UPI00223844C4|nr:putative holin [Verminephrobacter aporrectodeae]MCW5223504.1 hypothetical protein [Verminephrobacter aporrectodeae subsp. tuberculatae]MCW5288969.1 hypothetical protein [Verminephrobacter aporrectodeae subsp. tuberculatae]
MTLTRIPRMAGWFLTALLLIIAIALISPQQLPVALYKLSLISLAAVVAYWLDRSLFPYARPDGYLQHHWRDTGGACELDADYQVSPGYHQVFAAAMLRRAIIVGAVVIGVALGL